jgi:hypothetical protein
MERVVQVQRTVIRRRFRYLMRMMKRRRRRIPAH